MVELGRAYELDPVCAIVRELESATIGVGWRYLTQDSATIQSALIRVSVIRSSL